MNAEFFPLFDDDMKVLGPALVSRDEHAAGPGRSTGWSKWPSPMTTKFLGAVAAFRDIRNARVARARAGDAQGA